MKSIAVLLVVLAVPCQLVAQDSTTANPPPPEINYDPGIALIMFKLFISLVIIIGLIYLTVFLLRKFSNRTFPNGNQLIEVVGKSCLTPKQSLFVVKLGLTYAVLGVSENSVNLIKELSPEEADSLQQTQDKPKGFQNVLKSVLRK